MPELHFKGKEYVFNHHLSVPFRPLLPNPEKSIGNQSENIIIHGDNLHALKALLPRYAGKVDCIFIDPPYNTGEENWNYNDNVNSPIMREWLNSNPVNKEDMLRHDKWACMIYPRIKLLHELLSPSGSFWMTIDDNEVHRGRLILDEIFGEENFVIQIEWQKRYTRSNNTDNFTSIIDHLIVYRKTPAFEVNLEERDEDANARYSNPDNDPRGPWKPIPFLNPATGEKRPNLCYPITNPKTGETTKPGPKDQAWRNEREVYEILLKEDRFWWGKDGRRPIPDIKRFLSEVKQGIAPINFWSHQFAGNTDQANKELTAILGEKALETIKPVKLIQRVLEAATSKHSVVLDSFAGSGTTAHAVLSLNAKDGGNRLFILVECEEYADELTAERVRRVINGYRFEGTQKEELVRKKITWTNFSTEKAHNKLLDEIQAINNLDGHKFDKISKEIKDGELVVTGEKKITDKVEGLGGDFTFYTLGDPLDIDKILTGETLPSYVNLGSWLFHTATGEPLNEKKVKDEHWHLGTSSNYHIWLIYKPDLDFLKSRDAALTLSLAEKISETYKDKPHLVFAPAKFVPNKMLLPLGVEYAPLPFALYRVERD